MAPPAGHVVLSQPDGESLPGTWACDHVAVHDHVHPLVAGGEVRDIDRVPPALLHHADKGPSGGIVVGGRAFDDRGTVDEHHSMGPVPAEHFSAPEAEPQGPTSPSYLHLGLPPAVELFGRVRPSVAEGAEISNARHLRLQGRGEGRSLVRETHGSSPRRRRQ